MKTVYTGKKAEENSTTTKELEEKLTVYAVRWLSLANYSQRRDRDSLFGE